LGSLKAARLVEHPLAGHAPESQREHVRRDPLDRGVEVGGGPRLDGWHAAQVAKRHGLAKSTAVRAHPCWDADPRSGLRCRPGSVTRGPSLQPEPWLGSWAELRKTYARVKAGEITQEQGAEEIEERRLMTRSEAGKLGGRGKKAIRKREELSTDTVGYVLARLRRDDPSSPPVSSAAS
jgi:hypothetical protein